MDLNNIDLLHVNYLWTDFIFLFFKTSFTTSKTISIKKTNTMKLYNVRAACFFYELKLSCIISTTYFELMKIMNY